MRETNQQIPVEPSEIANHFNILYWNETFTDKFKAQIMYDGSDFAIAINSPEGTDLSYVLNRYSFAHELGHYCIPSQRETLIKHQQSIKPNTWSFCEFTELQEREAEYFAACLLMPAYQMKVISDSLSFDAANIVTLSRYFNVSMEAIAIRYTELSNRRTAVICTKHNEIAWKSIGYQLSGYKIHTPDGFHIHPQTLASIINQETQHDIFEEREIHHAIWLEHKENLPENMSPFKEIVFSNKYRNLTLIQEMAS